MATTVFDVLLEKIGEEVSSRESSLANGSAKDYAEYSHTVGTVRGLRIAQSFITDLSRTYMEDDND